MKNTVNVKKGDIMKFASSEKEDFIYIPNLSCDDLNELRDFIKNSTIQNR
jgi:hypothetical protein